MRPQLLIPAFLTTFALAGCQIDEVDFHDDEEIGSSSEALIGSNPLPPLPHHGAVAAITILLPPPAPESTQRTDFRYCTGVLVGADVVMTAATCLARNLETELDDEYEDSYLDAASVTVQFGANASTETKYTLDSAFNLGPKTEKGLTMHRYYNSDFRGTNDVALLKLNAVPALLATPLVPITPVSVNLSAEDSLSLVGMQLELVGYGKADGDGDETSFTSRRFISPDIDAVSATRITAGEANVLTTCYADSGGPGFYDFDGAGPGEPVVVSVSEVHGSCDTVATRERVDLFASDFVQPFVDYLAGDCTAGNGCGDCDYNGTCAEDCPTRDWDCELGSLTGEGCAKNGDCEEGGTCVPASDDPAFTYCSKSCSADDPTSCPSTLDCVDDKCIYEGISPGSQGATCSSPTDCRSGFCESLFCANECDVGDPSSCDAAGFACLPAEAPGATATVCRVQSQSGGGGFCAITPPGTSGGKGALAGFGLIFLMGLFVRRRSQ
jgi:hypothetical protein